MKHTRKILIALLVVMTLMVSVFAINASAADDGTITIYFENNWKWTQVKCYYWGSTTGNNPSWSGLEMRLSGSQNGNDVYELEIPSDVDGIIFNGLDNGTFKQTSNIETGIADGNAWKMEWTEEKGEHPIATTYTPTHTHSWTETGRVAPSCLVAGSVTSACSGCTETKTEPIAAPGHTYVDGVCSVEGCGATTKDTVVYVVDAANWGKIYCYYWQTGHNATFDWPGYEMTKGEDGVYYYTVPAGHENVIFTFGSDDKKSADLPVPTDCNVIYNNSTAAWSAKHNFEYVQQTAPTCSAAGSSLGTCACGATDTKEIPVDATAHTYVCGVCAYCQSILPAVSVDSTFSFGSADDYNAMKESGKVVIYNDLRNNGGSYQFGATSSIQFNAPAGATVTVTGHDSQYCKMAIYVNGVLSEVAAVNGVYTIKLGDLALYNVTILPVIEENGSTQYSYIKSISVVTEKIVAVDTKVTFGTSGNYHGGVYGFDFSGIQIGDNGGDNAQVKNGSFNFVVNAGAIVTIKGYTGYTDYSLNGYSITDDTFVYYAAAKTTLTYTPNSGNNYLHYIDVNYNTVALGKNEIVVPTVLAGVGQEFAFIVVGESGTYSIAANNPLLITCIFKVPYIEGDFSIAADGTLGADWLDFASSAELEAGKYYMVGLYYQYVAAGTYEVVLCSHTGGTATCLSGAICDTCGYAYGNKADHVWGEDNKCTTEGCEEEKPAEPETPHVNTLEVGDTNKIVISGNYDNGYGFYIEWVAFTATEKAHYKFAGEGLTIYIYGADGKTLVSATGEADLDAGTYWTCIASGVGYTPGPAGTYNVAVTKSALPTEPAHVNALVLGDNKFVVTSTQIAAYAEYIIFTAAEDGKYTFTVPAESGIKLFVFTDAYDVTTWPTDGSWMTSYPNANNKLTTDLSVSAHLKAGIYMVVVNYYYGQVAEGEYTINVAKTGDYDANGNTPVAPNVVVLGENTYNLSEALLNAPSDLSFEFLTFTADKDGWYTFKGMNPLTFFIWPDYVNTAIGNIPTNAPYVWNVKNDNSGFLESFTVYLEAGVYAVGFRFDFVTEAGEYKYTITYSETDPNPAPQPEPKPEPQPEPKPEPQPEPELTFFQKIMVAVNSVLDSIKAWFGNIVAWFKNIIPFGKG